MSLLMSKGKRSSVKYSELPCGTIVFRALIHEHFVSTAVGNVLPAAFFRRELPQDKNGLSLGVDTTADDYLKKRFRKPTYGVGTLHVGRVRDIGLNVVQDGPDHASLTGVPRKSENRELAERTASLLARQARWQPQSEEPTAEQE